MRNPLVSIIIPTYNSETTLTRCLNSIENQTYKNIEVIMVDKFSKDKTVEIAKKYRKKVFQVRANERSEQFNFGVKKSNGKYIYRVDSDFILQPTIVEESVYKCENERYDAICVPNTSDPTISFWSKVRKLERDCYKDDELNVAARFFRRKVFNAVGGFDEELIAGEDYDLHNRLLKAGYKISHIKAMEIHIGEPRSVLEIAKKNFYYGKTISKFIEKNKNTGIRQLSPLRPAFFRNWRNFAQHPVLTGGFLIYQFVKYSSAGLGYLSTKVAK